MARRTPRRLDRALALAPLPFASLAAVLVFAMLFAGNAYAYFARDLPPVEHFARDQLPTPTQVFARDGQTLLYEFVDERRELVTLAEVPQTLIDATVSAEDNSFWTNPGVDVGAIVRAGLRYLTPGGGNNPQGASTITQQLVKQRLVGAEVSLDRKVKEAILAIGVTERYSKEAILALYLNQIFYGNQAYGVKAAAHAYFGLDDLGQLTLAQAALLAGLPQSPTVLDPSKGENLGRTLARRQYVLEQMRLNGYIDDEAYRRANAEPIAVTTMPPAAIHAPHFVFRVKEALVKILGSEGAIERGGYTVVTTLDWAKQQEAEKQVNGWVDQLHAKNVFNAALVSIEPKSGEVLAYVGSVDYWNTSDPKVQGEFDAAGIGQRQAGSAFKVFNYVTALKRGATAATVVVDARTDFGGGYRPENADLQYHGPLTMRQAIRESRNVPAVKFLQQYSGIEETIATARAMGVTADFEKSQAGLSLTLGAVPVKLIDMTSAYAVLANGGDRIEPQLIREVRDRTGGVVYRADPQGRRVLSPEVAWLMTDMLKDTTQPSLSFIFGSWTNIGRPAALKTGTTDSLKDVYSVGYTPQLVTGVWMGNSDGTPMSSRDFWSAMGPGQLWRDYMKAVLKDVPVEDWPRPEGIVTAKVAAAPGALGGYGSGLLPSTLTPSSTTEYFVRGTVPSRRDDWYQAGCAATATSPSPSPTASPSLSGERRIVMLLKEVGPASWQRDRDTWIAGAIAGRYDYGRFPWSKVVSTGVCTATVPSQVSPAPSPTPERPRATPTAPPPLKTVTPPPTKTPKPR